MQPGGEPADDAFIDSLPKCELHVHLEGTLEAGTPQRPAAAVPPSYRGLAPFLADYYHAMDGLRSESDFRDLAGAYLERARAEGVRYAEMFFDPQAHTSRGVDFEAVVGGIHAAQEESRASGGPDSQLIMCFLRDHPVASALETLERSLPFRDWILGVGLDSDELGHPPVDFAEVFARARGHGYRLTMHCDPAQPETIRHLWECIDVIGVERIDHGVGCLADERLCEEIGSRRIGLTVCPLSNRCLYGDLMAEAVAEMLDRGLLVTVNSDDPAYFGGYLAANFRALRDALGLDRSQVGRLAANAFEVAWLDAERRAGYLSELEAHLGAGEPVER